MKKQITLIKVTTIVLFFMTGIFSLHAQTFTDPSDTPGYDANKASLVGTQGHQMMNQQNQTTKTYQFQNVVINASHSMVTDQNAPVQVNKTQNCFIEPDGTYTSLPANDDGYTGVISLPFSFDLYGATYSSVYVNNNGNITFGGADGTFSSEGFPYNGLPRIAPFWADVDTRGAGSALTVYKVFPHYMIATWNGVGYYGAHTDKLNYFQVIISDGTDPVIGIGNNIALYYKDMAWTTGDASSGIGGFGGTPATVGVNKGDGVHYTQVGRFDHSGNDYDGPGGANDGVDYLDHFCSGSNGASETNQPPSVSGLPSGNVVNLTVGDAPLTLPLNFIGPEVGQVVTTTIDLGGLCSTTTSITNGTLSTASITITAASCNVGDHTVTYTATDDYSPPGVTTVTLTVHILAGSGCVSPSIGSQSTGTQTQCVGGTFSAISVSATGDGLSYQWYSNVNATTSGGTSVGTNSNSYTPSAVAVGTLYYYCVVTGTCGTATSTVSGAFITNAATAISSQSTATQTQCVGGTFAAISVTATGTGTLTYQWYSNTNATTSGGTQVGTNSNSYTPSTAVAGTLYYYVVVSSNCGTVTSAISGAFIVNPNPAPAISGPAVVTHGGTNTYCTPLTTGNVYYWSGFGVVTPNANHNCIDDTFSSPCGAYTPWTITVIETVPNTGCSATATLNITIQ